ncbi:hypothetical protein ACEPAF_3305 [Sanghuangporus sanghuang]
MSMATTLSATSLAVTVAHAVTYLTRPLATRLTQSSLSALQTVLEASLAAAFAPTWTPHDPTRGSGRRVLSFAPGCLPPKPVYKACAAVGVDWTAWSALLSDKEFDLLVDPGSVCLRIPRPWGPPSCVTIWCSEGHYQALDLATKGVQVQRSCGVHTPQPIAAVPAPQPSKTLAQRLIEDDEEEDLFSLIDAKVRDAEWKSPVTEVFPTTVSFGGQFTLTPAGAAAATATLMNPAASFLGHSRSSSRSSITSAASTSSSFLSDDALSSCGSLSSVSTASSALSGAGTSSTSTSISNDRKIGHARSRSGRVFIDKNRTEVTPYDGGKTTVLTGGVMLGAPPARNSHAASRNKIPRF